MTETPSNEILMDSGVSFATLKPFVKLHWGEMHCQMTPEEARQHALALIECAEAAESDALIVWFLREQVKVSLENTAQILSEFRSKRGEFSGKEKT